MSDTLYYEQLCVGKLYSCSTKTMLAYPDQVKAIEARSSFTSEELNSHSRGKTAGFFTITIGKIFLVVNRQATVAIEPGFYKKNITCIQVLTTDFIGEPAIGWLPGLLARPGGEMFSFEEQFEV